MIAGRYLASGCSRQYCGWREGKASPVAPEEPVAQRQSGDLVSIQTSAEDGSSLNLLRRLMSEEQRKRRTLEQQLSLAEARAEKAVRDFYALDDAFRRYRQPWPVKAFRKLSRFTGFTRPSTAAGG
jgi:hypothetical protein